MAPPPAIEVDSVGKRYWLGTGHHEDSLGRKVDRLVKAPVSPGAVAGRRTEAAGESEEFWALRDISFELPQGDILGLIGANGSGKSTLLKMLSNITPPTEGRITLRGRVGTLLEVGTGFHPELTGRENVYLNGAILGMRRQEIDALFDEIVDFSGIDRSSTRPSSATPAACSCGSRSRSPRTSTPRSCWWTRFWPSATRSSSASAWARSTTWPGAAARSSSSATT